MKFGRIRVENGPRLCHCTAGIHNLSGKDRLRAQKIPPENLRTDQCSAAAQQTAQAAPLSLLGALGLLQRPGVLGVFRLLVGGDG